MLYHLYVRACDNHIAKEVRRLLIEKLRKDFPGPENDPFEWEYSAHQIFSLRLKQRLDSSLLLRHDQVLAHVWFHPTQI